MERIRINAIHIVHNPRVGMAFGMQYSLLYKGSSRCKTPTLASPGGASVPSRLHCEPLAVLLAALPLYTFFGFIFFS